MAETAMHDPRAIIDIGSNTVRMVIFGGPPRAPGVLFNEKVTAKLGKGVAENGELSPKAMAAALAALRRYAAILRLKGVTDWQCVATAAARDATNGSHFLEQVSALHLKPRLLSGVEEALASARGVMAAFPGARGVVGDLGGGSLELIDIDGGEASHGVSMPLGTLQLTRLRAEGGARFSRMIHRMLAGSDWVGDKGLPFYLVGGSWRALARYAMHLDDWPLDDPHGYEMTPEKVLWLVRSIGHGKLLGEVPGVSRSRLAALPDAAALLGALVRETGPSRLIFSSWGLREGLLHARLDAATRQQDPLLEGIAAFCAGLGAAAPAAALVAEWASLDGKQRDRKDETLRLAATMLSLASMQVEPNLRAELAFDWAMRKRWIGIDARARAMLAAAALANTGRTALPDGLSRLAPPDDLHRAVAWGLAVRLARRFSGGAPECLSGSALEIGNDALVLSVRPPLADLLSGPVERDIALLAEWLGLGSKVRIVTERALES